METSSQPSTSDTTARRRFVAAAGSIVIGSLITLTPIVSGILFFLDPILRRRSNFKGGDAEGFISVARLDELPSDGSPERFVIRADKWDAWNLFKKQTIGTVYLRKMPNNQVIAFNDTCPHLGCKVEYQPGKDSFVCPCHNSAFGLKGEPENKIPPRPLDSLECRTDSAGDVWVKYEEFQGGIPEKKALS